MESDEIHTALDAVQQTTQLLDVAGRVVQAAHHDILERYAALVRSLEKKRQSTGRLNLERTF